jgi:hypothetical protein
MRCASRAFALRLAHDDDLGTNLEQLTRAQNSTPVLRSRERVARPDRLVDHRRASRCRAKRFGFHAIREGERGPAATILSHHETAQCFLGDIETIAVSFGRHGYQIARMLIDDVCESRVELHVCLASDELRFAEVFNRPRKILRRFALSWY